LFVVGTLHDMLETRTRIREDFVGLWGRMGAFWGVSPATGRVYGWLLTQAEPQDADSIREGLDMSRGAVSMACRELQDWQLVHPHRIPGTRRVEYEPETNLERAVRNIVQTRKRREWDPILERLREWIPELKGDKTQEGAVMRERMQDIEGLVALVDELSDQFLKGGVLQQLALKVLVAKARRKKSR